MEKICSVSIDLDDLSCYWAIHGLGEFEGDGLDPIFSIALSRFLEIFEEVSLSPTLFVVGRNLENQRVQEILSELWKKGWELANHTYSHPYRLIALSSGEIEREIIAAEERIEDLTSEPVRGFRSPGYNTSPELIQILRKRKYLYDSSGFPCPPYYFAKAGIMALMRLQGKRSGALLGPLRSVFSPLTPYRCSEDPYRKSSSHEGIWQLPISVTPLLRFPFIGTSISVLPNFLLNSLLRSIRSLSFINFELHGIDLLDQNDSPELKKLSSYQPDLKIPWWEKYNRLLRVLKYISKTHRFMPIKNYVEILKYK